MYKNIKVIAFDADDTLWVNEPYFREAEHEFAQLLSAYETENKIIQELFKKEIDNLEIYGYGVKGFMLSLIESALELSNYQLSNDKIEKIINIGKQMLNKPIELLDGVEDTLIKLQTNYKIIVATKGDLLDQERKLKKSNLLKYFSYIEVMSEKKEENYLRLISSLDIEPSEFLMLGNSLKSDILPVLNIGASAIHIPYHTTWKYEKIAENTKQNEYLTVNSLTEILTYLE